MNSQHAEMEEDVRRAVHEAVQGGFTATEAIAENCIEYLGDEYDEASLRPVVARVLEQELATHRAAQEGWEGPTDCDRLDRAFAELERQGVVARQNFSCCGNCGSGEIVDEASEGDHGYVFYHMQDTDGAVGGGSLFFSYGSLGEYKEGDFERYKADSLKVAERVTEALKRAGLQPQWNGSFERRIELPINWKKRRRYD